MKSILYTAAALAGVAYAGVAQPVVDAANAKSTVTLTATTSVGCSKSVPTTAPNSKCNVTGTIGKPSLISTSKGSLQQCQDKCFFYTEDEDDCKTFGYNAKTKTCQLFDKTLPQMNFVAGDSDFVYSNQHCVTCARNPPEQSSSAKGTPIKHSSSSSAAAVESSSSSSSSKKVKTKTKTMESSSSSAAAESSSAVDSSSSSSSKKIKTKTKTMSSSTADASATDASSSTSSTTMPKPPKTKTKTKSSSSTDVSSSSSSTSDSSSSSMSTTMPKPSKTKTKGSSATATPHDRCASATVNVAPASQPSATGYVYKKYYAGAGYTENPSNPGNRNIQQAPINSTLVGPFGTDCDAITACATQASQASYRYFSFDLHLVGSTGNWVCTQYYDPNTNATYFDQKNEDVVVAYGFYNIDY